VKYEEFLRKYFLKASAVLLLVLIADISILVFGVMKLEKKAAGLSDKAEKEKQELSKLEEKVVSKEGQVGRISDGKLVMKTIQEQIFQKRSDRFIAFQKEIQELVRESGMTIDKFDYKYDAVPKDIQKDGWKNGYIEVGMNLNLEGSYPQIKKLVSLLEESGHFITIEGIALSQTNQGAALLDFKAAITTYFVYDPEEDMSGAEK